MPAALIDRAPAKINLTLRVLGRRRDGYHTIASLVAFVRLHDRLAFTPGGPLDLELGGPTAAAIGHPRHNLVLKAARALSEEIKGLTLGRFTLEKFLPVAAGLGGGSSDAAAALRLLARANHLRRSDRRIAKVARSLGADVPVCLDPRPRYIHGIGEVLSRPLRIPKIPVVLVHPGVPLATKDVFARHDRLRRPAGRRSRPPERPVPRRRNAFLAMLAAEANDLEPAAIALVPAIVDVLAALRNSPGCRLARMSGSGATCFGLFSSRRAATAAARKIAGRHRRWWVRASVLD
ncbi:MAG TPA: 4-(cytidine 5'-diphospho)-2-C-methyl-D-erythritol kinase [Xanthobacteraceae bacterium]|nr:4-(cytidine 5'-diphospho)-2-C-methyl-D-erythritol kinase [Xanthobacteraceae bacterium]